MDAAEAKRIPVVDDDMDTSETINGRRERAPAARVMDSGISTEPSGEKCRVGYLHVAFAVEKEVAKEHDQWRHFEMDEKIRTQSRKITIDGRRPALSARVAAGRNRVLGRELTEVEERAPADFARTAKAMELGAWRQFQVFAPVQMGTQGRG